MYATSFIQTETLIIIQNKPLIINKYFYFARAAEPHIMWNMHDREQEDLASTSNDFGCIGSYTAIGANKTTIWRLLDVI